MSFFRKGQVSRRDFKYRMSVADWELRNNLKKFWKKVTIKQRLIAPRMEKKDICKRVESVMLRITPIDMLNEQIELQRKSILFRLVSL